MKREQCSFLTMSATHASIVKIDPVTLKAETIINNFFQQPFNGFNDIDMDPNGNLWVTDSISAWVQLH
jgi:sugar lactone lactonase YvrE